MVRRNLQVLLVNSVEVVSVEAVALAEAALGEVALEVEDLVDVAAALEEEALAAEALVGVEVVEGEIRLLFIGYYNRSINNKNNVDLYVHP